MPYPRPCLDRECSHSTSPHDGKHACARVHAWHDRGAPEFVTLPRSTIEICPAPYATPVPVSENHAPMLHSSFSPVHMHELAGPTEPCHAAAGGIESIESGAGSAFVHVPAVRATGRQRRESSSNDARRPSRAAIWTGIGLRRVQPLRTLSGSTCRVILAILAALQLI
jgi:hypothetical protein